MPVGLIRDYGPGFISWSGSWEGVEVCIVTPRVETDVDVANEAIASLSARGRKCRLCGACALPRLAVARNS